VGRQQQRNTRPDGGAVPIQDPVLCLQQLVDAVGPELSDARALCTLSGWPRGFFNSGARSSALRKKDY
ncbi:hypothetical protein NHX12_011621, partial [Muraenolepis orangiensis]